MNVVAKALIFKEEETDFSEKHRITRGLQILAKYTDDDDLSFEHDVIFVNGFEELAEKMSEADMRQMRKLGWFLDIDNDQLSHF